MGRAPACRTNTHSGQEHGLGTWLLRGKEGKIQKTTSGKSGMEPKGLIEPNVQKKKRGGANRLTGGVPAREMG